MHRRCRPATTCWPATSRPASPPTTSSRRSGGRCRARPRSATPGRWTRSRPACCWCSSAAPRATQRFLMALPKTYEAVARFGAVSDTGDPDGQIVVTGRVPDGELTLPTGAIMQRPPQYSAVKVAGRRAYAIARAGETVELEPRPDPRLPLRAARRRRRPAQVRDRVLVGHVRADADHRARRRLLRAAAPDADRRLRRRPGECSATDSADGGALVPAVGDARRRSGAPGRPWAGAGAGRAARDRAAARTSTWSGCWTPTGWLAWPRLTALGRRCGSSSACAAEPA